MTLSLEYRLEISQEAYDDLLHIQNYTYATYGKDQWQDYGTALDQAMAHLLAHPFSGHTRHDVGESHQCWTVREHVMIYRVEEHIIYLVRVLHSKMNFRLQF